MKNKFIVFEGIEACGKSTQIARLADMLRAEGESVWTTAEPSNSQIGTLLRSMLSKDFVDERTAALLFAADRSLHVKNIQEHLDKGEWVLCDRYIGSSLAYQSSSEANQEFSMMLNSTFLRPDITFYIDITVEDSMKRLQSRASKKEYFDKRYLLEKISTRYQSLIKSNIIPAISIDGTKSILDISKLLFQKCYF